MDNPTRGLEFASSHGQQKQAKQTIGNSCTNCYILGSLKAASVASNFFLISVLCYVSTERAVELIHLL